MKKHHTPARRAAWLSLAAPALLATPAFAQDAPTPPPPVSVTVPRAAPPAAAPTVTPAPAPVAPATTTGSRTTIAPGAADVVDEARIDAARAARPAPVRRTTRATPARATPAQTISAPTPVAVAPEPAAAAPASAPAAPAPVAVTPAPAPVADAPAETAITTTTTTADDGGTPLWPVALIAALIVAAGAFFLMRRRRADADEDVYVEEARYEAEPAYVARVAAAAVAGATEDVVVTDAPAEDVAALTDGMPPVRNRPWLEFAMRPVRAGTSADEALVEIELTVANSGTVEARDVRVSTFMLTDANASEMERMMVDAPADAAIDPVSIAPGEGTRIDATLAALKSDLGSDGRFHPVVVAEARYRLADGTEGRTSASFVVGVSDADGGAMIGIDLADRVMRDDVEAQLHGEVEHA